MPIPARSVSHMSNGIFVFFSDVNNFSIDDVMAFCISSCEHRKRCIVFSVSFLQHGHLSEVVTEVFDLSVNRCFCTPVLDTPFINFTKREKSVLDVLNMALRAIPR